MNINQVCRMCLAHDTRMYTIAYEPLQKFYEKITGKLFKTDSRRLSALCYICYHLLKKCHRFTESAIKADEVLQQICNTGIQVSNEYISVKRNPLLFMAFKNSPVTIVNAGVILEVKSEDGKDSPDVNLTSSEQESKVATEIHKEDNISDVHIKEEADLDTTGIEENILCSEELRSKDHHSSDIHGDDNEDFENGSILAKVEIEDTWSLKVLEDKLQLRHHHSPEQDKDILDDVRLGEENGSGDRTNMLEKDGLENKDAIAKPCAVVLTRDERIERMLQETQFPHCLRARTPGPKNCKLDQTIKYIESLRVQASSRENTVPEKTLEIATNNSKLITEAKVKCSDNGHTQPYLRRKIDCEKQHDEIDIKSGDNVKRASNNSYNFNEPIMFEICNKTPDKQKFICDYCGNEFTQKSVLKAHVKIHNRVKPFTCSHCGQKFTHLSWMKRHLRIHTSEKPYKCCYCGKKFPVINNMKRHLKIHTGEKPHTCSHCGKKFTDISHMERHIRIHMGEKPFTCSHCGTKFSQNVSLKRHLRAHTGEKPFKCDLCETKFAGKKTLLRHIKCIHTGERPVSCKCDLCEKEFADKSSLRRHTKCVHIGEKPFTCSHCGKKFTLSYSLKLHLRRHTGEKPYKCELCKKVFANKSILTRHNKCVHMGVKPFTCSHCGKKFTETRNLKLHLRRHTGEKPFKCDLCEKVFAYKGILTRHIKCVHMGEKPFTCRQCGKKFARTHSLKLHLRKHTGENPFKCVSCEKEFANKSNLTRHNVICKHKY